MGIIINKILRRLLIENDMTAAQLARATGIAPQTINNWLGGQEPRKLNQLKKVADYFEITLDELVYGASSKAKEQELLIEYADEINAGTFEVVLRKVKK